MVSNGGFYGTGLPEDDGTTIAQKTHSAHFFRDDKNEKAILLIRNPFESLVAYRHFTITGHGKTARANITTSFEERKNQKIVLICL